MDERITELESIALAAHAKKGRMDAASRDKASALLASIWADSSINPEPTLRILEDLKAEAIAEALRSCWPRMDISRKNIFQKWVPGPSTEKAYRRLTFLVTSIIEFDGATALHWLGMLVPRGRKNLSKESRKILASILFGKRVLSFDTLLREASSAAELLRICAVLFDIAADPSLSVSAMTRSRLASAILGYFAGPNAPKDTLVIPDLRAKIVADAKRWPPRLREQMILVDKGNHAALAASPPADVIPDEQPERAARPEPIKSAPATVGPLHEELPRLEEELNSRIAAMTREVELLRRVHECIAKLVEAAERSEAQRKAAMRELQQVQESLRHAESERDKAREDSAREIRRANELAVALEQVKVDAQSERKRLGQQISANASGRITEFKNRLGLSLSRLIVDLPGKEAQVSAELGKVLLLQFHQFLDALRQEGVETHSTRVGSQ